jgi:hypothetical protein
MRFWWAGLLACLGLASALAAGTAGARARTIKGGRYGDGSGNVYLVVRVQPRTASFHFNQPCLAPSGAVPATSGPAPPHGEPMASIRPGTSIFLSGFHDGPAPSGSGVEETDWQLSGSFAGSTHFRGMLEFETGVFPAEPLGATQCVAARRLRLRREP